MKILLAVDGSEYSLRAAHYLATHFDWFRGAPELHLLNVRMPIPAGLAAVNAERLLGRDAIETYYRDEATAALTPTADIFKGKNITCLSVWRIGDIATEIHAYAKAQQMDLIVMGSHGHGALGNLFLGSVSTKVLAGSHVPVLIIK